MLTMGYPHARSSEGCVSVSVGLASAVPDDHILPLELVRRADAALYAAKAAGRNCHAVSGAG